MTSPFLQAAAVACCTLMLGTASAEENALSLAAAGQYALNNHPALAAHPAQRSTQKALAQGAALSPPPSVEFSLEDFAGSGNSSGSDGAQATLSLSQVLELGGQRARRQERAESATALLSTEQEVQRRDILAAVAAHFVETLAQQHRLELAKNGLQLAQRMESAVQSRVDAAAAPAAERIRAAVVRAEAELELEDQEHRLQTQRMALAEAMGMPKPRFGSLRGALFTTEPSQGFEALMASIDKSPALLRLISRERLAQSELMLARSRARGELRASLGIRQRQVSDDTAWVAGLSLPLFSAKQAAPGIAAKQAEVEALGFEQQASRNAIQAQLFALDQEMRHAQHVLGVLDSTILPALDQALALTEAAYREGRYSWLQLQEIQEQLRSARLRRIAAAEEFHLQRIEIERLSGLPIRLQEAQS
ncbi:MAG: TolC family protein [Oceanococcaceae bacterium]